MVNCHGGKQYKINKSGHIKINKSDHITRPTLLGFENRSIFPFPLFPSKKKKPLLFWVLDSSKDHRSMNLEFWTMTMDLELLLRIKQIITRF